MENIIIIPTLNPNSKLIQLINKLQQNNLNRIIVVNDGSNNQESINILNQIKNDVTILVHEKNEGKGKALKTAFNYILENEKDIIGCITADGDGQHLVKDILKLDKRLKQNKANQINALVLGVRNLYNKAVPFASRFGNGFSYIFFKLQTGVTLKDTQTGLRGLPLSLIEKAIKINGNRYDYEMNMLTEFALSKIKFETIPIETIYEENNKSSHFRAFKDSFLIYKQFIRYSTVSILSAIVDLTIFTILVHIFTGVAYIYAATAIARISSGCFNFFSNRKWSFKSKKNIQFQILKYISLFITQMCVSGFLVNTLSILPINVTIIKIFVDSCIFIVNYIIERRYIY